MQANVVQLAVFLGLTALVALATWWRYGKEAKAGDSAQDFFLAGKHLSWPFIAGSLLLTNISAEQIVGMNGAQNLLQVWWEFGAAAGLLVLAKVLVPMYYKYNCTTTTELLERRLPNGASPPAPPRSAWRPPNCFPGSLSQRAADFRRLARATGSTPPAPATRSCRSFPGACSTAAACARRYARGRPFSGRPRWAMNRPSWPH